MARIPESELERLKNEVSVERLVEASGVELKRGGKDMLGRCLAVVRKLTPAGHARNPRYVLRPLRACAGHGLGVPSPCPANTDARAHPGYRLRKSRGQAPQAARSWSWPPPAHHPPPEGAPGLSPLSCPA